MNSSLIAVLFVTATLAAALEPASPALPNMPAPVSGPDFKPQDFGAIAGDEHPDTQAIQQAIDAAHEKGGGVVRLRPGTYLSGTIHLRSRVTLHLEVGATLLGSPRIADYRRGHWPALILAREAENIAITGHGTIDGQGALVAADTIRLWEAGDFLAFYPGMKPGDTLDSWNIQNDASKIDPFELHRQGKLRDRIANRSRKDMRTWRVNENVRPQLIEFSRCRGSRVTDVTLRHATNWVQTYRDCEDLHIARIRVDSTTYWNNDGLDIVDSRRVLIEDCQINAADDGICLKSEAGNAPRGCEDITIRRNRVRSSASAFKLGTASHQSFRRITVEDLEVFDTFRSAIALETVDGATLEDIRISRVRAHNTGNAFFLRIGQRQPDKPPGHLRRVLIEDLTAHIPSHKPDAGYHHEGPVNPRKANQLPASIIGLADRPIEQVEIRKITLTCGGNGNPKHAEIPLDQLSRIPEARDMYPEFSNFGELPAWGIFLRDAAGITFTDIKLALEKPDFRPAITAVRASELNLQNLTIGNGGSPAPVIALAGPNSPDLHNISWPASASEKIREIPAP